MPVLCPSLKINLIAYRPIGLISVISTSSFPNTNAPSPPPWPFTSAEGEKTLKYLDVYKNTFPSGKITSNFFLFLCSLILLGICVSFIQI